MLISMKDIILQDLNIFFNVDEFADLHEVNGQQMPVVFDADILKQRASYRDIPIDGVYYAKLVVFVKTASLGKPPVIGSVLRLDGNIFLVSDVSEANGILELTLEANET